ncbi:Hypothetical protein FKW44_009548, partial [Caligus rogercresseyi]
DNVSWRSSNKSSRIDLALAPSIILELFKDVQYRPQTSLDHKTIDIQYSRPRKRFRIPK